MDIKDIIGSIVRGGVQVVVGVLASKGIVAATAVAGTVDAITGLVVGGILFVGTLIWSLISKKKALDTPVK